MGARMRAFDWSSTTLGAPEGWPSSLRASIRVMLTSRFAMWMAFGPDLTFFCNDAYLPTTGNKSDWVLGARSDKVWAEIWPDIGPRIEQVLATGEATWDEALLLYLVRRGYAEETYHTFSYSPLDDDEGRPAGMLCVVAEVTEKVIGARQLDVLRDLGSHLAAARTRSEVMRAFEASLQAEPRDLPFSLTYFVSGDATQVDLAASHGLTREAGFAAANIGVGDPDAPWPVEGALEGHVQLVTLSPSGLGDFALDFWQTLPANAFVVPVMSAGARAVGFFVAGLNPHRAFDADYRGFVDLVAAQLAAAVARADEFDRATARAEALAEIDQAKTTFFSNVSHEFRTPLTLMLGPLEEALAENATLPALERDRLQVVHRNGLRLLKLVNSLLDFSRIEAGRLQASFVPTDLAAMTADLASSFSTAVEKAGLSLIIDCRKLSAPVYIDHDMWEKVVLNLLSNAFKFTFEGSIAIRVQERHGEAEIVVQDTGIGIAADEMPRLFERFHRIEGARGRSHEGTGIGLALVWELLKLQGGTIKVESEPDVGTTFIIAFPFGKSHLPQDRVRDGGLPAPITARARAFLEEATHWPGAANQDVPVAHPARVPPDPSPIAATGRRPRVLFADDNHDMRGYVSRLLATECDVQSVPDGLAALQAARANTPDLILTDVMMPRLDGFGLVHAIRTDPALRDIPVIMLSARAGEEASIEGREAGVDDYLAKPFSAAELRARVRVNLALAKLRKAAVLSLSESERRFRAAVDAVDGILWTNNAAGEMEGPQPGWSALTGQAYDDYQGFGWARAVHPDDAQPTINAWNDAVAERRPFAFEHRVRRHDGAWRIFAIRAIPILSEDGSIREWVGVHTDITERREAEAEQSRLAAVVEQSGDFVGFTNLDRKISFVNSAGREMLGLAAHGDVRGKPLAVLFSHESRKLFRHEMLPAVANYGAWSGECEFRHFGSGAPIPAFFSIFLVRNVSGAPIGYGLITRDLTKQKKTAEALRSGEARLQTVFETVPVGIIIGEAPSGRIIDGNRQVEAILGHPIIYSPDIDSYGAWVSHHADGRTVAAHDYPLARALAGEPKPELEVCYQRGDGQGIWVRFIGAPIKTEGRITGAIVVTLDIDKEKRAIEALNRIRAELEARVEEAVRERESTRARLAHAQRMEALGQLAGGIAHDFNNVLQAVAAGLNLIQRRAADPEEVRKIAKMAADAAGRGASVTARLLAFARKSELRAVPVSAAALLESLREILVPTLGSSIAIQTTATTGALSLLADKAQLETVMVNLAVNARDAMPGGGSLNLTASAETVAGHAHHPATLSPGAYIRLDLTDTGIGMDTATLARAAEPFFTTKGPGQGTGLGLAMARGFAQQSGGGFTIESAVGKGTTVTLWFPQASAAHGHAAPDDAGALEHPKLTARVMVVDDDDMVREMLARELEELGFKVIQASDGLSALAHLDSGEAVDLLVTDLSMPGMNGMALTHEARRRRSSLPVMLLTGYADANLGADFDANKQDRFVMLRKPVDSDELARHARDLLLASAEKRG